MPFVGGDRSDCQPEAQGLQENRKLSKVRTYFDVYPFSEPLFDVFTDTCISLS